MKRTYESKKELLPPTPEVEKAQAKLTEGALLHPLLLLVYALLHDVAEGHNCYITIGGTRSGDAFLVTLSEEGHKYYAAGEDLISLSDNLRSLVS